MGREIRKVPANWEHPKTDWYGDGRYHPMYDQTFEDACLRWKKEFIEWPESESFAKCGGEYWEYAGDPPDREYYRAYKDDEATWYQVYETVSEGTPVTPPFATKEELIQYLVENGDFWDQARRKERPWERGNEPWPLANAIRFVTGESSLPSMMVSNGQVLMPKDI